MPFLLAMGGIGALFVLLLLGMLIADASYTSPAHLWEALGSPEIRYAIKLSLFTCTITMLLSVICGVAISYLMSRFDFPGKHLVDVLINIPLVLPPLVVGLSLLLLCQTPLGLAIQRVVPLTYAVPGVILAQFPVACALVIRTMRATFAQMTTRQEQVALTLGCSRSQAFWRVVLPEARQGLFIAATLAWARALGEFGPVLVFAGATRLHTEVLPTTIYLELSVGHIEAALAVSLVMVVVASVVLLLARHPLLGFTSTEWEPR
ncbi:MAG: ABC transporter permease [Armatimonadota bacterium]